MSLDHKATIRSFVSIDLVRYLYIASVSGVMQSAAVGAHVSK